MTDTVNLGLPCIDAAQAQKHVTHNEALRILDTLVQLAIVDRDLATPPGSPIEGQRWLVAATPAGAWLGQANHVAAWQDGAWQFSVPKLGWLAYIIDEGRLLAWNGSAWIDALSMLTSLQNIVLLGVGTTADTTNPFSAKLNNALWAAKTVAEGGDGNLRYKLSKESVAKTLSFLFQDNFSGRAEIGLTGDDDFHFKTSADGTSWIDALTLDKTTGAAKVNSGFFLTGDISPSQITADQNDYNPAGLATASVLRLSSDASRNITGLSGGGDGRVATLINVGSNNIVLKDASTSSSAGNRFSFGADVSLTGKQSAVLWYDATDSRWKLVAGPAATAGVSSFIAPPRGRLTLQSAAPVMMTTQSGKTTIYYSPYDGNQLPLYDGVTMVPTAFSELSAAATDTVKSPSAIGASKVNDWFVWNDSGTIRLGHGPDWTNDTTRSAGTALVQVNGIWLNNAAITNGPAASRGTYVGTTRSNGSSQLDWIFGGQGTAASLMVWNCYNRRPVVTFMGETTDQWTYQSTTVRAANNTAIIRATYVSGINEDFVSAQYAVNVLPTSSNGASIGVQQDATTTFAGQQGFVPGNATRAGIFGTGNFAAGLGVHYVSANEACANAVDAVTFYGDNGDPSNRQGGMTFTGYF